MDLYENDRETSEEIKPEEEINEESAAPVEESPDSENNAACPTQPAEETQEQAKSADGDKDSSDSKKEEKKEPFSLFLFDLLELAAMSLAVVMLILTFVVRQSPVNGNSMYPTIRGRSEYGQSSISGDDILLISDLFYTPATGDIVVVQTPTLYSDAESSMDHSIVKRVIAVGGDTMTIDFDNWRITVNGEVIEGGRGSASYVNYSTGSMSRGSIASHPDLVAATVAQDGSTFTLKIPEGMLFVMGDNRNNSFDSRSIGFVDERWVAGKAILRIFPFDRFGTVESKEQG